MSRILFTWELGLNLGHLTRLLPIAERLKADGHTVLIAVRDIQAAATVLRPAGIPFVQAPHLPRGMALSHRPAGFADILLSQGWGDRATLWGLVYGWLNLLALFKPDYTILDYSPTVTLATRIAKVPSLLIGNGFELPPAIDPLPPFPGFSWATAAGVTNSEKIAVANANDVLGAFRALHISALRDVICDQRRVLTTFPELDHYGAREREEYAGPLLGRLQMPKAAWPISEGPKLFAVVRPDTSQSEKILSTLAQLAARVICVAIGFSPRALERYRRRHIHFALAPIDLQSILDADIAITYGAEGTMLRLLMEGIPQIISPWHVETYMAGRRYALHGVGALLPAERPSELLVWIQQMAGNVHMQARARSFAKKYKSSDGAAYLTRILETDGIRRLPSGPSHAIAAGGM